MDIEGISSSIPHDDQRSEQFVSLFARHQSALFGYVLSLLPNWSDAEDAFQQTSVVLWRKFDQFDQDDPQSDFVRWACQIARYTVLNRMKQYRRDRHVFSDTLVGVLAEEGVSEVTRLDAERRALAGCLDQLQSGHRRLVRRCYSGTSTIKQIAQALGCTPNSLYKRLNRIRALLLRCIERTLALGGER